MKQHSAGLWFILISSSIQLSSLLYQVQGGIITNQQSLGLPAEIADAVTTAQPVSVSSDAKNSTRSGRVMYTAPYSNVRITSKESKSMKNFPFPTTISKKAQQAVTVAVGPVLRTSTTTSTTTTTTTTEKPSTSAQPVEQTLPEIIEIVEEIVPDNASEVVTEAGAEGVTEQSGN